MKSVENKKMAQKQIKSLVIQNVELTESQKKAIGIITPKEFIRERIGKGNKRFNYVETGYVVARLNQAFGPLGWNFTVKDKIIETGEVAILVELTFKATNGFEITKSQWGQAQRHNGVALGDSLKAATSDGLKKAASLAGVALDVYWPMLDMEINEKPAKAPKPTKEAIKKTETELFDRAKKLITEQKDGTVLFQWQDKIDKSKLYSETHKKQLLTLMDKRLDDILPK